jgi:hypothetical protein
VTGFFTSTLRDERPEKRTVRSRISQPNVTSIRPGGWVYSAPRGSDDSFSEFASLPKLTVIGVRQTFLHRMLPRQGRGRRASDHSGRVTTKGHTWRSPAASSSLSAGLNKETYIHKIQAFPRIALFCRFHPLLDSELVQNVQREFAHNAVGTPNTGLRQYTICTPLHTSCRCGSQEL